MHKNLIPAYAELADPLVKLTSPSKSFKLTEIDDNSFKKLQEVFFKEPFLQRPNYNKMFYLNTDASAYAISAVLLQKHKENLFVAYFSKALRKADTR